MSSATVTAQEACAQVLAGLDADIFDYIVGILEDIDDDDDGAVIDEDTAATVEGFLLSAEYCETEEEATEKTAQLRSLLVQGRTTTDGGNTAADAPSGEASKAVDPFDYDYEHPALKYAKPPTKEAPTSIAKLSLQDDSWLDITSTTTVAHAETNPSPPTNDMQPHPPRTSTSTVATKLEARLAKKKGRATHHPKKSKPTAAQLAQAHTLELDQALTNARIAAVHARQTHGAYKGALEVTAFALANPGGGQPLLEDAACTLVGGRRYGLIGRNGMGKSTLLRALAARQVGNIPVNVTVHYVSQEVQLTDVSRRQTPVECVVEADMERTLLLEELHELEALIATESLDETGSKRHGEVLSRLDEIGSESAHRRATSLLEKLGFSPELRARPLEQLSGGWRVRTMLAAAIFAEPDLLLLDEPTNHLSILAVMWLARELSTSDTWKSRTVVIVSHDRHFMDEVCTDCLHISGAAKRLTQCRGNYSKWDKQRKEQQALFAKEQAHRQEEIAKLREYAGHGFKYGGSASQINKMGMKAKQADKLEEENDTHADELAALQEDMELPINIADGGELDGFIVQLLDVGFGYRNSIPARQFEHCEFGITAKSRIVLLGENGNGKTTLVKLIIGELKACEGEVRRSPHARFAIVNQHHADQIDLTKTPLQFIAQKFPGDGSYDHMQKLRGHLSSCGVTVGASGANSKLMDLQNTPASALSGGQRSRVALAAVSFARPHVLVLDEPTNNLDLESVAALAESVRQFKGAVICVSHDQFFVQAVANEAWVVNGGKVRRVESFDAYRMKQLHALNKRG